MKRATQVHINASNVIATLTGTLTAAMLAATSLIGCARPEKPAPNVVADAEVRGCTDEISGSLGPLDVAIVIDTSQSTGWPTGFDINRDGVIRPFQRNSALDRGDSRLAAQIASARLLLEGAKGHDIRFSLITFSGPSIEKTVGRSQLSGSVRDSQLRAPLTRDVVRLDAVLMTILNGGSDGRTMFAAGMRRGTRALSGSRAESRRKVILMMSDSARPNGLDANGSIEDVDPRMASAANIARHNGVVIHTFGLSPDASHWRREAIGQIAGATGGTYHPIDDPAELYCHLASALLPSIWRGDRGWEKAFAEYRKQEVAMSDSSSLLD